MVAVPAKTGVINPELLIVAIVLSELLHVPPDTVEENVFVLLFKHIFCVPDSEPAEGLAVMVIVRVSVAFAQPPEPVTV